MTTPQCPHCCEIWCSAAASSTHSTLAPTAHSFSHLPKVVVYALSNPLLPGPGQHLTRAGQREQTGRTSGFISLSVPGKLKCIILSLTCSFFQNTGSHRDFLQPQRNTFKCFILRRYFFPWSFFFIYFLCLFSNLSESTAISKLCCCCCCCFPPDAFLSHF